MARPTKLTRARVLDILGSIRTGSTQTEAAHIAIIATSTLREWLAKEFPVPAGVRFPPHGLLLDEDAETILIRDRLGRLRPLENSDWIDYSGQLLPDAIERAKDEYGAALRGRIEGAALERSKVTYHYGQGGRLLRKVEEYDWKAAAWILERHPDHKRRWRAARPTEPAGPEGATLDREGPMIVEWTPNDEWMQKYAQSLAEAGLLDEVMEQGKHDSAEAMPSR